MQVRNRGDLGANSSVFVRAAHFQRALILREHASATIGIRIELGHFGMNQDAIVSATTEKEVIGAFGEWWDEEQQQKKAFF